MLVTAPAVDFHWNPLTQPLQLMILGVNFVRCFGSMQKKPTGFDLLKNQFRTKTIQKSSNIRKLLPNTLPGGSVVVELRVLHAFKKWRLKSTALSSALLLLLLGKEHGVFVLSSPLLSLFPSLRQGSLIRKNN